MTAARAFLRGQGAIGLTDYLSACHSIPCVISKYYYFMSRACCAQPRAVLVILAHG
jgi:hypothetical protein